MDARLTQAIADIGALQASEERATAALALLKQQIADIQARGDVATSADLDALSATIAAAKQSETELDAADAGVGATGATGASGA